MSQMPRPGGVSWPLYGPWIIILAIVDIIFAIVVAMIAAGRDRSAGLWFLASLVFGGVIPLFIVLALPYLKECPNCAEKVKEEARICRYCGTKFQTED